MQPDFIKNTKNKILFDKVYFVGNYGYIWWVTKQTKNKRFDMTQTPDFVFNKNTFAWAVNMAWDFEKHLFDCIAGLRKETESDKLAFQKLETVIADANAKQKLNIEKDSANLYLSRLAVHCHKNPDSQQTKAFVELWKLIFPLFPNKQRPLESVSAFKCLLTTVKDLFESKKAQYYIMHAFAHNNNFERPEDYKRALTLLATKNDNATIADLMAVLDVRSDKDEEILRAVVEKCYAKVVELEKVPAAFRDNRKSGDADYKTKYAYKVKSFCLDALRAIRMLNNISPRYAMNMKDFFEKAMERAKAKPKIEMPDINDLSQFPRHAAVLQSVRDSDKHTK